MQAVNERATVRDGTEKITKKVEKTFEKPLDKRKEMWYNNQVAQNAARQRDLPRIIDN